MNWNSQELRYFLAVYEQGGVGRAAEMARVSQPAISRSILKIEERLDVKLFERVGGGMVPTTFGAAFARQVRIILHEIDNTSQEIDALKNVFRGSVSIACSPSMCGDLLAEAALRLANSKPALRIHVYEGLFDASLPRLVNGELDLMVGTFATQRLPEDVVSEDVFEDEVSLVVRTRHELAGRRHLTCKLLTQYKWILATERDALRMHLESAFAEQGSSLAAPTLISNSAHFIKSVVMESDYLTYLPRRLTRIEEDAGLLKALPFLRWRRKVRLARRKRGSLSPAAAALISELQKVWLEQGRGAPSLRRTDRV